jgi:hypothetical protein
VLFLFYGVILITYGNVSAVYTAEMSIEAGSNACSAFDPDAYLQAEEAYGGIGLEQGGIEWLVFPDPQSPDYTAVISHEEHISSGEVHARTFSYAPIFDDVGNVLSYAPMFTDTVGGRTWTYQIDPNSGVWAYADDGTEPSMGDPAHEQKMYRGMQALLLRLYHDREHATVDGEPFI